jgi:predicted Rossmann fold nucleotide-binding protein DprA/Smf involved in DNA uptake
MVRGAGDVLDELFGAGEQPRLRVASEDLDPVERRLLDGVEAGLDVDALATFANVEVGDARAALARMELAGLVRREGLGGWERARP